MRANTYVEEEMVRLIAPSGRLELFQEKLWVSRAAKVHVLGRTGSVEP
jgi:hypothetical protein